LIWSVDFHWYFHLYFWSLRRRICIPLSSTWVSSAVWQFENVCPERSYRLLSWDPSDDLSGASGAWKTHNSYGLSLDVEAQLLGNRLKFSFSLSGDLVDLECSLYLLRRQLRAKTIYACHLTSFKLPWLLSKLFVFFTINEFGCQLIILVNFLFCVPEPFVDLIFSQAKFIWKLCYWLTRGSSSFKLFVKIPKRVFLALRLASSTDYFFFLNIFLFKDFLLRPFFWNIFTFNF